MRKNSVSFQQWCIENNRLDLIDEWDYAKNSILPANIASKSGKKVWWICKEKHAFEQEIEHRVRGHKCPYCTNSKVLAGFNDLETVNPSLAKEWHPVKNGDLLPSMVTKGSGKKVWWIGKCGHEWQAVIASRNAGNGCPYCSNEKIIVGYNDLATTNINLLSEWDYEKNTTINPTEVTAGTNIKVWWGCKECGNSWYANIVSRARGGHGCPACGHKKVANSRKRAKEGNDILAYNLQLKNEWNYEKNEGINPLLINKGSDMKVWWICEFGHEWQARVSHRVKGIGCPQCAKALSTSFPEQAILFYLKKYFDDVENSNRSILQGQELDIYIPRISTAIEYDGCRWHKNSNKKDKEKNIKCRNADINLVRIREAGLETFDDCTCIVRSDNNSDNALVECITEMFKYIGVFDVDIDIERDRREILEQFLAGKRENSISNKYPEVAKEWHPTKNGKILPSQVAPNSDSKFWWIGKCGHEWQATPNNRVSNHGCPFCSIPPVLILAGFNDLKTTNPVLAEEWNYGKNGELLPSMFSQGSSKKVWWIGKCGHEWQAVISSRTGGRGCPYCSNERLLVGYNDLATTNSELVAEWNFEKNGDINPTEVIAGTNKKVWWIGKCGHEWQAVISSRTKQGTGCPYCVKNSVKRIKNIDTGIVYDSMAEAAKGTGVSKPHICQCCKGQRKTAGGYHWTYV